MKITLLILTLIGFSIPTCLALAAYGYVGFFRAALTNLANLQVFIDLSIALALINLWMIQDTRRRGDSLLSLLPYLLISLLFGSYGPLLYLLRQALRRPAHTAP